VALPGSPFKNYIPLAEIKSIDNSKIEVFAKSLTPVAP
jgi:hypothetical protein